MKKILLTLSLLTTILLIAYGDTAHSTMMLHPLNTHTTNHSEPDLFSYRSLGVHFSFAHFPLIVLIIVPFFQMISLKIMQKEIGWIILMFVGTGCITALVAINHPDAELLLPDMQQRSHECEYYNRMVVLLCLITGILKMSSMFLFPLNRKIEYLVFVLGVCLACTVVRMGHLNVYLELNKPYYY